MMRIASNTGLDKTLRELLRAGKVEWLSIRDGEESDLIVVGIRVTAETMPTEMSAWTSAESPSL